MADLAASEGRTAVVDEVAASDNRVDLSASPPPAPLASWLADAPLDAEEAALVQPTYGPVPTCDYMPYWQAITALGVVVVALAQGTGFLLLDRLFPERSLPVRLGGGVAVGTAVAAVAGALAAGAFLLG